MIFKERRDAVNHRTLNICAKAVKSGLYIRSVWFVKIVFTWDPIKNRFIYILIK